MATALAVGSPWSLRPTRRGHTPVPVVSLSAWCMHGRRAAQRSPAARIGEACATRRIPFVLHRPVHLSTPWGTAGDEAGGALMVAG